MRAHQNACVLLAEEGGLTTLPNALLDDGKKAASLGIARRVPLAPPPRGGGLMARRRTEPGCNRAGPAGWLHPSVVTALKLLDGYYFHYYYFNAPLWTHCPVP